MNGISVLFLLVCFACLQDVRTGKIPNALILMLMAVGIGQGVWREGIGGGLWYLARFGAYVAAGYLLYRVGAVGAGDVKLLAGIEGFLEWESGLVCLGWMALAAGILALVRMLRGDCGRERIRYFLSYVGEIAVTGRWRLYLEDMEGARGRPGTLHLSVPMLAGLGVFLLGA